MRVPKNSFKPTKIVGVGAKIISLEDAISVVHSDQANLEWICKEFYTKLYTANPLSKNKEEAMGLCFEEISNKLTDSMKNALIILVVMSELEAALNTTRNRGDK